MAATTASAVRPLRPAHPLATETAELFIPCPDSCISCFQRTHVSFHSHEPARDNCRPRLGWRMGFGALGVGPLLSEATSLRSLRETPRLQWKTWARRGQCGSALGPTASLLSSGVSTARRGCRASGRGGHVCRHVSVVGAEEVQSGVAGVSWECQEGAGRAEEPPGLPRALRGWRPVPELRGARRNPLTGHPAPEARGQRRRGAEGSRTRSAAPRLLVSISQVCVP